MNVSTYYYHQLIYLLRPSPLHYCRYFILSLKNMCAIAGRSKCIFNMLFFFFKTTLRTSYALTETSNLRIFILENFVTFQLLTHFHFHRREFYSRLYNHFHKLCAFSYVPDHIILH